MPTRLNTEEVLHVRFPFGGCSHRHSYPPSSNMPFGKRKGTASIPIDRQSMRKTASEHQMAQDEAEADYKDFVFFSRVVDGISRQNSLLKDGSFLKSTNEILIDNIVRARHERNEDRQLDYYHDDTATHYYQPQQTFTDLKIVTPTRIDRNVSIDSALNELAPIENDDNHVFHNIYTEDYEEDEGIFDLEL